MRVYVTAPRGLAFPRLYLGGLGSSEGVCDRALKIGIPQVGLEHRGLIGAQLD